MKHIGGLSILVFVAAMLSLPSAPRVGTVDHKVFVNHKGHRICVALPSVPSHLAHGDVTNYMPCS